MFLNQDSLRQRLNRVVRVNVHDLLANFDLTFRIDRTGQRVRWEPIPAEVRWRESYPLPNASFDVKSLQQRFPTLRWEHSARRIVLDGPVEAHDEYQRQRRAERGSTRNAIPAPTAPTSDKRYSLSVQNQPLEGVLRAIGQQAGLDVQWDANVPPQQLVTFSVQRVTLQALVDAATEGTSVRGTIAEGQLQLHAR